MRNVIFSLLAGFLFVACGDDNPTNFYAESSSSEAPLSSSAIGQSSSSDIIESSSSFEAISSSTGISSSTWAPYSYGELIDERDGQIYKTIKIGEQTWMAENLNYAYPLSLKGLDSASYCYNNDPENCIKYGRLYTWAAAMDSIAYFKEENDNCLKSCTRDCEKCGFGVNWQNGTNFEKYKGFNILGVCPENWHIPSVNEWFILLDLVNTIDLKSTSGWIDDGNGTDIFGFGLLPAGTKKNQDKNNNIGEITCFWTPLQGTNVLDETGTNNYYEIAGVFCFSSKSGNAAYKGEDKTSALSVRCIKD
jgi:uncharacterized protein (TIGR02145 family)